MSRLGMESKQRPWRRLRPWVEWRARGIDSPVERLRYLQSAAVRLEVSKKRALRPAHRKSRLGFRLLSVFMVFIAASFFAVRAKVRVEPLPVYVRRIQPSPSQPGTLPYVWQVEAVKESET